jgi:PAS domain S-box-containing protein
VLTPPEALPDAGKLLARIRELEFQLRESESTLHAIGRGDVEALVVRDEFGKHQVYTLETADQPYRVLIEQMQEGAVTVAADGTMYYCNRRFAEMLELPQESLIGKHLQEFVPQEDAATLSRMVDQAIHTTTRGEFTFGCAEGRQISTMLSLSFLRRDMDIPLLCGVITDITEQKHHRREIDAAHSRLLGEMAARARAEEALYHAQKLEAIGRLAAGVAHDFNNVLQSIVSSLELVLDDLVGGSAAHEFADIALEATKRGSSLTGHLLSYARKQMLRPRATALAPFLADLESLLSRSLGPQISIHVRLDGQPSVLVDPGQLQTALLNLAINSAHAMPQGGTLRIDVKEARADYPWVVLTVTDGGQGMDAETLARAVEPFFTTKGTDGTGLGLSMVQGFVEQTGGKMYIESTPARGTRIEMCLPPSAPEVQRRSSGHLATRLGRILLVDDTPDVLLATGAFLTKAGFTVCCAGSGEQALALLAEDQLFDALVTDYAMPGLSGVDLITKGRIVQPGLPAVIITGFAGLANAATVPVRTLLLQKPFQRSELIDSITRVMEPNSLTVTSE